MDLRANTAHFEASMATARKGIKDTGAAFHVSERQAANFAAKGLGLVSESAEGAEHTIGKLIEKALKGRGALLLLGQAAVVVGGALAVGAVIQAAQHYVQYGEAIWKVKENLEALKKVHDEERAALQKRGREIGAVMSLEQQLTRARGELAQSEHRAMGDEIGELQAATAMKLQLAEQERTARERNIIESIAMGTRRTDALLTNDQIYLTARRTIIEQHEEGNRKIEEKSAQEQIKMWQSETQALQEQLKARLDARNAFLAQLGEGAAGLGIQDSAARGFRAILDVQENVRRSARDIAGSRRDFGMSETDTIAEGERTRRATIAQLEAIRETFGGVASVEEAAQRAIDSFTVSSFTAQIEAGRQWIDAFVASGDALKGQLDEVNTRLTTGVPAAVDKAAAEIRRLTDDYIALSWAIYFANVQNITFNRNQGG